jgi:hypothetical protein
MPPDTDSPAPFPLLTHGVSHDNSEMTQILHVMEKLLHWAAIVDSSDDAIISKSAAGFIPRPFCSTLCTFS